MEQNKLIPIKGIDETRKKFLNEMGINDTSDLMLCGRTRLQREKIAEKIMYKEKPELKETQGSEYIKYRNRYIKYVESWVKQADLWRISEMDPDTAYLLVELGIRSVEDVVCVDPMKAYPMMVCLARAQADYTLISMDRLNTLISNAKDISDRFPLYQERLTKTIQEYIMEQTQKFVNPQNGNNKLSAKECAILEAGLENLLQDIDSIRLDNIASGGILELDDTAPTFLFATDESEETETIGLLNNLDIINEGLGYLNDIEPLLPLPATISGSIYMVSAGQELPNSKEARREFAFTDAKVEIEGVSSPSEDKGEDYQNPVTYTDVYGNFVITMPEKYNLEEKVTLIVSQGLGRQKIVLTATDVLAHVKEQQVLKAFGQLDMVTLDKKDDEKKLKEIIKKISGWDERTVSDTEKYKLAIDEKKRLEKEIETLCSKEKELKKIILSSDSSTTDFERILRNLINRNNLDADYSKEPFVLTKEIFKGYRGEAKKVLPSVKLMENDNQPIYLPTDTAPARIYSYSMLQRLVEPAVYPLADRLNGKARITLNQGIDVSDFKNKLMTSPNSIPQMSSLGIGYVLNMHQAWIPDGFALGNLLYSLVLAPGEEQRLVVREKKQSYQITDNATGTDQVSESYINNQTDNTDAAYKYAVNQLLQGNSHYDYSTKSTSVGAGLGVAGGGSGISAMLGLSVGHSTSNGRANSSASQSNAHNEVSSAAQNFQHSIKTASEKISSAQRISMSMATGEETDSVATRIIANHNHSHTMTIQYWEVMRRYKLETCIDGVDLVLFVPIQLINFLNGNNRFLDKMSELSQQTFRERYSVLLEHADVLNEALPYKYRNGMKLIQKYATLPEWKMSTLKTGTRTVTFSFYGNFLSIDNIEATLILKNGKRNIAGETVIEYDGSILEKDCYETSAELKNTIKEYRRRPYSTSAYEKCVGTNRYVTIPATPKCICTFEVPEGVTDDELSRIVLDYSCGDIDYVLYKSPMAQAENGESAHQLAEFMWGKVWDLAKDNDDSGNDIKKIDYAKSILPEAWVAPNVYLSTSNMKALGIPKIMKPELKIGNNTDMIGTVSSVSLSTRVYVDINGATLTLKPTEVQEMEATLHHVASNTMRYSQAVWSSLSSDERAMMLEKYTIDMDYSEISDVDNKESIDIPLLNCIDVKKMLGFYGNCMLFPFTYPQELAIKIEKTAGELQDALYRYHTNYFRVPTTVISLPTEGMIGESVLGQTNVSEEIDLTRFWNWQDSPIDNMSIDSSYLNDTDYLEGKTTKDIAPLNLVGATATAPVTVSDLVSALVNKQAPSFDNITGLDQLKDVLNTATQTNATGRDAVVATSADLAKTALEYSYKNAKEGKSASDNSERNDADQGDDKDGDSDDGDANADIIEEEADEHDYDWETEESEIGMSGFDKDAFEMQMKDYFQDREQGKKIDEIIGALSSEEFSEAEVMALAKFVCEDLNISSADLFAQEE